MTDRVLVVGYGSALRTDDGLGWHAAERLADDPRLKGATVLRRHQLTPELALDVSQAALVVLVDAHHGPAAGTFTIERVERADGAGTTWSHHLSPSTLVALAHELYGRAPDVYLVSVGVDSLEVGERMSPLIEAALPRVVNSVAELIVSRTDLRPPAEPSRA
jgi:hydrogenase maturation protease